MFCAEIFHALIPTGREHIAFARQTDGPILNAEAGADRVSRDKVGDILNGGFVSHADVLPYSMAIGKPYEPVVRHFSWQAMIPLMENAPYGDIAARIRWHRAYEGLNQTDYATQAGIKRSQLSNWETGQQRVSVDGALQLRDTYGLSLDFIYAGNVDALPMTLRQALRDKPLVSASK